MSQNKFKVKIEAFFSEIPRFDGLNDLAIRSATNRGG